MNFIFHKTFETFRKEINFFKILKILFSPGEKIQKH